MPQALPQLEKEGGMGVLYRFSSLYYFILYYIITVYSLAVYPVLEW